MWAHHPGNSLPLQKVPPSQLLESQSWDFTSLLTHRMETGNANLQLFRSSFICQQSSGYVLRKRSLCPKHYCFWRVLPWGKAKDLYQRGTTYSVVRNWLVSSQYSYVEVLTLDMTFGDRVCREVIKFKWSKGGALIHSGWCPYKKTDLRDACATEKI